MTLAAKLLLRQLAFLRFFLLNLVHLASAVPTEAPALILRPRPLLKRQGSMGLPGAPLAAGDRHSHRRCLPARRIIATPRKESCSTERTQHTHAMDGYGARNASRARESPGSERARSVAQSHGGAAICLAICLEKPACCPTVPAVCFEM